MTKQTIAGRAPVNITLEKDKAYSFCTCGESAKQPFCDGSHKKAGVFSPHRFTVAEDGEKFLCMCKHTQNAPFCDGSHKKLD